jgi:hypothetical protein
MKKDPKAAIYKGALDELRRQKAAGKDTSAADVQKALMAAEFRSKEHDKANADYEKERRICFFLQLSSISRLANSALSR